MPVNSVQIQNQNNCYHPKRLGNNYQTKPYAFSKAAFGSSAVKKDVFEYNTNAKTSANSRILELKEKYKTIKAKQGIIAKPVDLFKNLFHTKNCSNNIEKATKALNNASSEEEFQAVEEMLEKYASNQESATKGIATTTAMIAGGAVGAKAGAAIGTAICPGIGTAAGILIGAIAGAVTCVFVNQVENMTDKVKGNSWQNDKNLLKEAGEGALAGASSVIMGGITQKITGKVASKIGLKAVENGGKTALVALAEDGTAKVGATIAKNAIAGAVGSGAAAAIVADGEYVLECAVDKDKKFSLTDLGTTTATSFGFGGLIGGVTGGIQGYKGAKTYNNALKEVKAQAEAKLLQTQAEEQAKLPKNETPEKITESQTETQQRLPEETKPAEINDKPAVNKTEEPAKVVETQGRTDLLNTELEKFKAKIADGTLQFKDNEEAIKAYEALLNSGVNTDGFFYTRKYKQQRNGRLIKT